MAGTRAALDDFERRTLASLARLRELIGDLEQWAAGGEVPASATRYASLSQQLRAECTGACRPHCRSCFAAHTLKAEYWIDPNFESLLETAMLWSADRAHAYEGDLSAALADLLAAARDAAVPATVVLDAVRRATAANNNNDSGGT